MSEKDIQTLNHTMNEIAHARRYLQMIYKNGVCPLSKRIALEYINEFIPETERNE